MATGITVQLVGGNAVLLARQLPTSEWVQEVAVMPARWTGVSPSEKLSVGSGVAIGLSPPSGATHALVVNDSHIASPQAIRYYDTGDTPTTGATGNGAPLEAGQFLEIDLLTFSQFKMICIAAGQSATIHVLYRKYG